MRKSGFGWLLMAGTLVLPTIAYADVKAGVEAWDRGDYATAIGEWRDLATRGDADAQFNMGQAYKLGRGVTMNLATSEDWFRRAAMQGHIQAEDNLGLILFQNNQRDEALPYIKASAARGEPRAQYVLGTAHFNGDLVSRDWPRAYALMTRASAAGLPQASRSLTSMDQYIPLDQRQQGIAMAAELEREADRLRNVQLAGLPTTPSPRPGPKSNIEVAQLPPSQVAQPPAIVRPAPPSTAFAATAGAEYARPPARAVPPPVAAAAPAPARAVATSANGNWRVQLGAFSSQGKAEALWSSLEARNPSLATIQPYLVNVGNITRLQAGPFGSKAEADRLCAALSSSGQACFSTTK